MFSEIPNSNIVDAKIKDALTSHPTKKYVDDAVKSKQDALSSSQTDAVNSGITNELVNKLKGVEEGAQKNPDLSQYAKKTEIPKIPDMSGYALISDVQSEEIRARKAESDINLNIASINAEIESFEKNTDDTLKEIADYIIEDDARATKMSSSISKNANLIDEEVARATQAEAEIKNNYRPLDFHGLDLAPPNGSAYTIDVKISSLPQYGRIHLSHYRLGEGSNTGYEHWSDVEGYYNVRITRNITSNQYTLTSNYTGVNYSFQFNSTGVTTLVINNVTYTIIGYSDSIATTKQISIKRDYDDLTYYANGLPTADSGGYFIVNDMKCEYNSTSGYWENANLGGYISKYIATGSTEGQYILDLPSIGDSTFFTIENPEYTTGFELGGRTYVIAGYKCDNLAKVSQLRYDQSVTTVDVGTTALMLTDRTANRYDITALSYETVAVTFPAITSGKVTDVVVILVVGPTVPTLEWDTTTNTFIANDSDWATLTENAVNVLTFTSTGSENEWIVGRVTQA